jgi:hypothetical protein
MYLFRSDLSPPTSYTFTSSKEYLDKTEQLWRIQEAKSIFRPSSRPSDSPIPNDVMSELFFSNLKPVSPITWKFRLNKIETFSKSESFCKWWSIICKIIFMDFFHRLNYKILKLQRFGSWPLIPSSGKMGEHWTRSEASLLRGLNRQAFCPLHPTQCVKS